MFHGIVMTTIRTFLDTIDVFIALLSETRFGMGRTLLQHSRFKMLLIIFVTEEDVGWVGLAIMAAIDT